MKKKSKTIVKDGHTDFLDKVDFKLEGKVGGLVSVINALAFIEMNKKALLYNQDLFQGVHLVYECNHCNEARDAFYWQITDIVEAALKHRLENHTN